MYGTWLRTATARLAALTASALGLLGGCDLPTDHVNQDSAGHQTGFQSLPMPSSADRRPDTDAIVVVQMQFDVLHVELPIDQVHHSEKIWNHVDELRQDPARTSLLRRNGFRMGVASADDWPALRALFEACNARVLRVSHTVQQGLPLTLELDPIEDDETIFLLTADNRMVGTTFDRGTKYLHLDYALSAEDGCTTLMATPEIHRTSKSKSWESRDGQLQRVAKYQGKVFHELTGAVRVCPNEFLIIGADATQASTLSAGRQFLARTREGRDYETVLCITPQPFRTEGATP